MGLDGPWCYAHGVTVVVTRDIINTGLSFFLIPTLLQRLDRMTRGREGVNAQASATLRCTALHCAALRWVHGEQ